MAGGAEGDRTSKNTPMLGDGQPIRAKSKAKKSHGKS